MAVMAQDIFYRKSLHFAAVNGHKKKVLQGVDNIFVLSERYDRMRVIYKFKCVKTQNMIGRNKEMVVKYFNLMRDTLFKLFNLLNIANILCVPSQICCQTK